MAGLDANTNLLLHCDGIDTSTTIPDSSITTPKGNATVFGTAQLDTAQQKWGTASLLLDGNSDYITYADSVDWDMFGSNADNWTLDLQVRHATLSVVETYFSQGVSGSDRNEFVHHNTLGVHFAIDTGGATAVQSPYGGLISDSNWHHVAICKVADEYGTYLDGVLISYVQDSSTATQAAPFSIGAREYTPARYFDGHIDEFRVQKSNYFGAAPSTTTFVGDTNTSTTIDSIVDTSSLRVGMNIQGTDITAGGGITTSIVSIDSGTAITINEATTGTTADVTFTVPTTDTITLPTGEYSSGPNIAEINSVANIGKVNSVDFGDVASVNSVS